MPDNLESLSRRYRTWIIERAQHFKLDPMVTRLLTECVDRRVDDLEVVRRRVFGQELEDEIFQVAAHNVWAALNDGPAFDRLLQPTVKRAEQKHYKGIRDVFLSEQESFGDQRPAIQAFLDQAFPIEDTGEEQKP